jgi:trans-2-enoyl-CoA reductase
MNILAQNLFDTKSKSGRRDKYARGHVPRLLGLRRRYLQDIRLGLNCVGGKETAPMAWLLAPDAHLVTYGAMSKEPLSLPTSCLIFGNLTCHGFWQSRWYAERTQAEREDLIRILANLIIEGKVFVRLLAGLAFASMITAQLREPKHRIVTLGATDSDEEVGQKIRDIIAEIRRGRHGMKVLLRVEHR